MKKNLLILLLFAVISSCKKENIISQTETGLKGTWRSSLVTDIIYDTRNNQELTRLSYLNGLGTEVTFDGKGTANSTDTQFDQRLTHSYSLRIAGNRRYLTTELAGFTHTTEYEILNLYDTQLQLKGTIETNQNYNHSDGLNYNVYYERTEYFTRK